MSFPTSFRVWDGEHMHTPPHGFLLTPGGGVVFEPFESERRLLEDHEPLFFTSRTDQNGTPIYQHDVVDYKKRDDKKRGYIRFQDGTFELVDMNETYPYRALHSFGRGPSAPRLHEVVGNVHENPELAPAFDNE